LNLGGVPKHAAVFMGCFNNKINSYFKIKIRITPEKAKFMLILFHSDLL